MHLFDPSVHCKVSDSPGKFRDSVIKSFRNLRTALKKCVLSIFKWLSVISSRKMEFHMDFKDLTAQKLFVFVTHS